MKKLFLIISIITLSNVIVFSQEIESGRTDDAKPSGVIPVIGSVPESNKLMSIQQEVGSDQDLIRNVVLATDSLQNDQVIADDLIVTGSIGCGFDMVNNYSFGFNTFVMKENNLRVYFEDTSVGDFPSNDWVLEANESSSGGVNHFAIIDVTGSKVPFKIIAGAPTNSFYLSNSGNIGSGTSSPILKLHLVKGDTPGLRLDQDGSSGWTPQIWDLAGNESNFFIRDVTGGSKLPFRIQPGTPTNTLTLKSSGKIGLGTWSPEEKLHINGNVLLDSILIFKPIGNSEVIAREGAVYLDNTEHNLRLYNGSNWVSLADNQNLTLTGNELSIEDGNAVNLSSYLDNTDVQEISLTNDILTISGSNSSVDLSKYLDIYDSDDQVLELKKNFLYIEDGNSIELTKYLDNTDNQELMLSNDLLTISGSITKIDLSDFRDNTDGQEIKLVNDTLSITGSDSVVVLSHYLDNTDNQSLSVTGNSLLIENGNSVDLSIFMDNSDSQEIKLINDTLSITGSDSVIVLSNYLDNTDSQLLSLTENELLIENGNSVDLSVFMDNTDEQAIKLTNNILSITQSDSKVDLSGYLDDTDEQTLLLKGTKLSISNGNEVDLSALLIEKQQQIDELSTQVGELNQAIIELRQMVTALGISSLGDNTIKNSTIGQNIPNPFSMSTVIPYNISDDVKSAVIVFYSQKGQLVKQIKISGRGEGTYTFVTENNDNISLYSLYVDGNRVDTKKMIMAK